MSKKEDTFYITIKTTTNEILRMKHFKDGRSICPVCGSISIHACSSAWDPASNGSEEKIPLGYPSFDICRSCDTQFGLDDFNTKVKRKIITIQEAWTHLRMEWLYSMKRLNKLDTAIEQLKNIDISEHDIKKILEKDNE